ncbi:MAG: methylenetetrahydrofolate reductase [Hyphomicrobiaceae bacterium]
MTTLQEATSDMKPAYRSRVGVLSENIAIASFMSGFSVEAIPSSAAKIEDFRTVLRPVTTVYITALPGADYRDAVALAKRLREQGFEPVPHVAARSIRDQAELEDFLARASGDAGVKQVLVIAGGVSEPVGTFTDSMQLLETGAFDRHGIERIGIAGHPEGSPDITDEAIQEALVWKNAFAERTQASLQIVTQFCFEAAPVIAWDKKLNAEGNRLPIQIGIPGIANLKTLLNYARSCGVGNSIQFLKKQAASVSRLLKPQAPDVLVRELAAYARKDANSGIAGVHMYPLGGLKKTANWCYAVTDGEFTLTDKGLDVNGGLT